VEKTARSVRLDAINLQKSVLRAISQLKWHKKSHTGREVRTLHRTRLIWSNRRQGWYGGHSMRHMRALCGGGGKPCWR